SISLILCTAANAQVADSTLKIPDTTNFGKPDNTNIKDVVIYDTSLDTRPKNKYGDLLDDDPAYNRKYPWYVPATRVVFTNVVNWAANKYLFHYDWADISLS